MSDLAQRLQAIRLLALDVDGVLTDGGISIDTNGTVTRRFYIKDGLGIKLLIGQGVHVGIVTFANNEAIHFRAKQLGIEDVHIGAAQKHEILDEIRRKYHLEWNQTAFMGDDWVDLSAMQRSGVCFAPADAIQAVRDTADRVTTAAGGRGAVREVCDLILQAKGADPLQILQNLKGHD